MSVYDDISTLIDDEEAEIETARSQVDAEHQKQLDEAAEAHRAAVAAADEWYDNAVGPLQLRTASLEALRGQVTSLAAQAAGDPQVPSAPEPGDTSSPSTPTTPADSPSQPSAPDELDIPPADESAPSTPSGDDSQPVPPITAEPIVLGETSTAELRGVDDAQPVAVPLFTGEIAVIPASDVLAAQDPSVPDEELSPAQIAVRNSDLP